MSWRRPARFAVLGFNPSSAAMEEHNLATSMECCNRFCPYDERYFIRPIILMSSGLRLWIPKSITVRLPVSTISCSTCFSTFLTTSSIRAGWIRPSVTSFCNERRATSRRIGSKPESKIASGLSSMMISTPVRDSRARMFLPSRPMIRPLISSFSILNTDTVFSMACSAAVRCMVSRIIFLASWFADILASSTMSREMIMASAVASSFIISLSCSLASNAERPEMVSNIFFCSSWILSNSA